MAHTETDPLLPTPGESVETFLRRHVLERAEVERFLDPAAPNWGVFDPELGYLLRSSFVRDGIDGTFTIATYLPTGERRVVHHPDRPCRLRAYGDSYTQCQQVSDGETWEEYLAGHLGEPVRNFGVGGYGVWHSFRRMVRTETARGESGVVLWGIFGIDDHYRSLDAWRRVRCGSWFRQNPTMFHANPWDHVRPDPDAGGWMVRPNPLPTPESLFRLCDPDAVVELFGEDDVLHLYVGSHGGKGDLRRLARLAERMGTGLDPSPQGIGRLHRRVALGASLWIAEQAREFCAARGLGLLAVLTYGAGELAQMCAGAERPDQPFVDGLREREIPFFDAWEAHRADYAAFRLSPADYVARYCIPHYNPAGNHFLAYALRGALLPLLDPKPAVYGLEGEAVGFASYLPGGVL